ncbi:Bicyclomycin resistance protein homolog [Durusdinium trenchii]|uniref:Bicyclomycin resistance protein homolog n=1 Tax=Durusdinium trenchii TaxID=1381693 RepID=A0ABP0LRM1_9DINO
MTFPELVAITAAFMALNALAIDMMLPALGQIGDELGAAHDNDRQLIIVVYVLGNGIAQLFFGPLADRFGRKTVLMWALGGYMLGSVLSIVASSFSLLLAARAFQGVATAGTRVAAIAVVRDQCSGRRMAEVMSLAITIFMAAPILAPGFGQLILFAAPWRGIFFVLLLYGVILMMWTAWRLPETMAPEDRKPLRVGPISSSYYQFITNRISIGYTMTSALCFGALFGYISASEQIFLEIFELGQGFALAFAAIAGSLGAATLINARLVSRFGMRRLTHSALLVFIIANLLHLFIVATTGETFFLFMAFMSISFFRTRPYRTKRHCDGDGAYGPCRRFCSSRKRLCWHHHRRISGRIDRKTHFITRTLSALTPLMKLAQRLAGQSKETRLLETRVEAAAHNADAALRAVITPETLAAAEPSVYMVVNNNRHYGSAFVLDRERGILVTAAHVAADLNFQDPDNSYTILNRYSKKRLRIRAKEIHAGFDVFRRIIEDYQPLDPESRVSSPRQNRVIDIANDAALLFVDPIDANTGENLLGPDLPLASETSLAALAPGDPIAVIGYPIDTVTSNIEEDSAAARVERGVISTMLSPIDQVENAGNPLTQNLIVHRMAAAPGNSGGPILNRNGEIIGISSHGHDSTHSNGDSLAQRADVIYDMITPFREQDGLERVYIPDWRQRLAKWPQAEEILPYVFYRRYAEIDGERAPRGMKISELEIVEDPPFEARTYSPDLSPAQEQFVLYADDLETDAEESEEENNNSRRTSIEQKPVFLIDEEGEYASYSLRLDKDKHHAIFAFDYSMAWTSSGYCPLALYFRREGDSVLHSTRATRMPSFLLEASDDAETSDSYNIIVRRRACDAQSKEYLFGIVSWESETQDTQVQVAAAPNTGKAIFASFEDGGERISNFINCNIDQLGDDQRCQKSIKVQNFTAQDSKPQ